MGRRAQSARRTTRGQWWTTRAAALCPVLAVLLAALVVCLGSTAHAGSGEHVSAVSGVSGTQMQTGVSGTQMPTGDPTVHHTVSTDCPPGGECCAPAVHEARRILAAPSHPLPVLLPRSPDVQKPPGTATYLAQAPPTATAPDLHVLQVQRS
ncbi:hypothetical protein [Streptomyces sp. NPDC006012]|uniref:hypothetical protein n=1 Tax=Streptomyces sp. NPDC006012 TaxID=3364739 RepID=UPI0036C09A76